MSTARLAGAFYLVTFVTGAWALGGSGTAAWTANAVATVCYVAVALLFHALFKPVNARLSLVAAVVGLAGCAASGYGLLGLGRFPINPLALFGAYCTLIGSLILQSSLLPRVLGWLMIAGGLSWLTFFSPSLARVLSPYNFAPGIIGEGLLTLWLLAMGARSQPAVRPARTPS